LEIRNGKHFRLFDEAGEENPITALGFIYQYLIQQGYAVPLFYGVGHPMNGKTAIELGLALDATAITHTPEGK
jgi:hypothetical protein